MPDTTVYYGGGHLVKVIGWGSDTELGLDYWLIQNSWGTDWGEEGFAKIGIYNDNDLGIKDIVFAAMPHIVSHSAPVQTPPPTTVDEEDDNKTGESEEDKEQLPTSEDIEGKNLVH